MCYTCHEPDNAIPGGPLTEEQLEAHMHDVRYRDHGNMATADCVVEVSAPRDRGDAFDPHYWICVDCGEDLGNSEGYGGTMTKEKAEAHCCYE